MQLKTADPSFRHQHRKPIDGTALALDGADGDLPRSDVDSLFGDQFRRMISAAVGTWTAWTSRLSTNQQRKPAAADLAANKASPKTKHGILGGPGYL